jgi:hypothetical protein
MPARSGVGGSAEKRCPLGSAYNPKPPRIWFSRLVMLVRAPPLFSRFATSHSRLPSRFPGPGTAVIFRLIWLRSITRPSRSRCNGPSVRERIGHDAVAAVTGADMLGRTTLCVCPAAFVRVLSGFPRPSGSRPGSRIVEC